MYWYTESVIKFLFINLKLNFKFCDVVIFRFCQNIYANTVKNWELDPNIMGRNLNKFRQIHN